jgi:hypothetical protein
MNTLLHINTFLLVARVRSFSGAARELGIAPSVVTKRITLLEEQVGSSSRVPPGDCPSPPRASASCRSSCA